MHLNLEGDSSSRPKNHVLVFGGNGFMGSATVGRLLQRNGDFYDITIVNRGTWYWDSAVTIRPYVRYFACNREDPLGLCTGLIDEYLASLPPNWSEGKHITAATLVEPRPRVPASGTPYQRPVIDTGCPDGWVRSPAQPPFCYKLVETPKLPHDLAEASCVVSGGHLVSILDAEEQAFVQSIVGIENAVNSSFTGHEQSDFSGDGETGVSQKPVSPSSPTTDEWFHIGLDGLFHWTDGNSAKYENMNPGDVADNCAGLFYDSLDPPDKHGMWKSLNCNEEGKFMCKRPNDRRLCFPESHLVDDNVPVCVNNYRPCPAGYNFRHRSSCYKLYMTELTWDMARGICANDGGNLVDFETQAELLFMGQYLGNHMHITNQLIWVNSTSCMTLYWDNGALSNTPCEDKYQFVCEIDMNDVFDKDAYRSCHDVFPTGMKAWIYPSPNIPPIYARCEEAEIGGYNDFTIYGDRDYQFQSNSNVSLAYSYKEKRLNLNFLSAITDVSLNCEQHIGVSCINATVFGGSTWWTSRQGYPITGWGAPINSSNCACNATFENTCVDKRFACNCHSRQETADIAVIDDKRYLPIRDLHITGLNAINSVVNVSTHITICETVLVMDLGVLVSNQTYYVNTKCNENAPNIHTGGRSVLSKGDTVYSFTLEDTNDIWISLDYEDYDAFIELYGAIDPMTSQPLPSSIIVRNDDGDTRLNPEIHVRLQGQHTYYLTVSTLESDPKGPDIIEMTIVTNGSHGYQTFDEEIVPSRVNCMCLDSDINSVCTRGRCECRPGFAPDHMGNCEKVLGMDCNHDLDCASYVYGSHCVLDEPFGTVCKCKPGWYERNFECSPCHCLCDGNGNCTNSGDHRADVYCTCEPASRTAAASEATLSGKRDNMGKRFVLSFFGNALLSSFTCTDDKKDVRLMLKMTSYSDTPADVRVSTPLHPDYPPVSVSVQKGKETTVSMPRALFKSNATGFATDSILVESSRDIAVFGLAEGPGFSGGYLALPVDVLGQEYVALCSIDSRHSDDYSQHSEIIIIAVESDTRVRITMPKVEGVFVIYNGSEFTRHRMLEIRLSKYETFHIHSEAFSLTQTFINSDRPIAVISGAREQFGSTKDIVLEMMPPMSAWGRMYTMSPRHSEASNNWTLVILSSRSEQSYVVAQGNNQPTLSITRERHVTYETYAQSLLTITAREHDPILVGVHTSCRHLSKMEQQ
ncbi:uncharacterized protein LOC106173416 [Lingula anatina]|uniref:Uncharacterized protein LOC106173416 n=1 Tax=Lingula anatina TaxID=7574 RepID=A0A1S3JI19_LINAN|nr:uncharacterized protein LOC106173416 [Lingula anatina]|eukprot:XP_013410008.1 uncharacterized protein LOC106173416 [Lingula anatina]